MNFIKEITKAELRDPVSRWTGNDANKRFHSGLLVPTDTRDFVLHWKKDGNSPRKFVACFRLNLRKSIDKGLCKMENGKVRVTFYHDNDDLIRLRVRRADEGGLTVARLP